ncbi:MAG TPA: hypothetical protein VLH09_07020 [Bryobacteraceae bacterium]|nr:hypothetical protein [Bryobacteraceae bacterium]
MVAERQQERDAFLAAGAAVYDQVIPPEGELPRTTFSELENALKPQADFLAALLCEKRLRLDPLAQPGEEFLCPHCARRMRVQNHAQERKLDTLSGAIEYQRPYCVCDACGFCGAPLDRALGIPTQGPSIARRELICYTAAQDRSFERARRTLARHRIRISDEAIRQLAEGEGRHLNQLRDQNVEDCFRQTARARSGATPELLVITCDGGMIQTCDGEPPWKSDKIGCVYDALPRPDIHAVSATRYRGATARTKTYVGTMRPWADLGRMLYAEAVCRGSLQARQFLFLSDGAEAIKELRSEHFPNAFALIDWFHAGQHLHDCAKAAFPENPAQAGAWAEATTGLLWNGQLDRVIDAIRQESLRMGSPPALASAADPRLVLQRNVGYFTANQREMDYPTCRAHGWPIGSGVAESAVKLFGLRLKGSEKFWCVRGAEEMLGLCALYYSEDGRWDRHWRLRAAPHPSPIQLKSTPQAPAPALL